MRWPPKGCKGIGRQKLPRATCRRACRVRTLPDQPDRCDGSSQPTRRIRSFEGMSAQSWCKLRSMLLVKDHALNNLLGASKHDVDTLLDLDERDSCRMSLWFLLLSPHPSSAPVCFWDTRYVRGMHDVGLRACSPPPHVLRQSRLRPLPSDMPDGLFRFSSGRGLRAVLIDSRGRRHE